MPSIKHNGQVVARWDPSRGWSLTTATLDWDTRLGPLTRKPLHRDKAEAIAAARDFISSRPWHSANLVLEEGQ